MTEMAWRKSSYSGGGGGNCVEVAPTDDGGVALRDTKDRSLPAHIYTRDEWVAFVAGVKAGEFDF
ncbi:MAG: DUF397 domain-containing protein [Sciscionella sp.]